MWFTDTAGRIGRIDMDGAIREFPIGRRILSDGRPPFEPSRPIVASPEGDLWFIAGPETIGRMSPSGHVRFFQPHSSYRGTEALGDKGNWSVWHGVPKVTSGLHATLVKWRASTWRGTSRTVTNRLVNAYGIAFGRVNRMGGRGPRYITRTGQARRRIARTSRQDRRLGASQAVPLAARVSRAKAPREEADFAEGALGGRLVPECERLQLGHVTIRHLHSRGPLIVVSQTPRAGTPTVGYRSVKITVAPAPPLPKSCRGTSVLQAAGARFWAPSLEDQESRDGRKPEEEPTETYYDYSAHRAKAGCCQRRTVSARWKAR